MVKPRAGCYTGNLFWVVFIDKQGIFKNDKLVFMCYMAVSVFHHIYCLLFYKEAIKLYHNDKACMVIHLELQDVLDDGEEVKGILQNKHLPSHLDSGWTFHCNSKDRTCCSFQSALFQQCSLIRYGMNILFIQTSLTLRKIGTR